jgi:hypothetical protein
VPEANILTTIGGILAELKDRNGTDFLFLIGFMARSIQTKRQVQSSYQHYSCDFLPLPGARCEFVEGFADGYGLLQGTRHRAWDLYIEWLESAMMAKNISYWMEAGGYGPGFAVGVCACGED